MILAGKLRHKRSFIHYCKQVPHTHKISVFFGKGFYLGDYLVDQPVRNSFSGHLVLSHDVRWYENERLVRCRNLGIWTQPYDLPGGYWQLSDKQKLESTLLSRAGLFFLLFFGALTPLYWEAWTGLIDDERTTQNRD